MIHKCAVFGCPNRSDSIIHYCLPEDIKRRERWVQFIERGNTEGDICLTSRICGVHFSEDSFTKLDLGFTSRLILNVDAVPSVYPEQSDINDTLNAPPAVNSGGHSSDSPVFKAMPRAFIKEEPLHDGLECDVMRAVKEEPMDDNVYGEDDILARNGLIVKEEVGEDEVDVDEGMSFQCAQCGDGFKYKDDLKRHELKHKSLVSLSSKSYSCKICEKTFAHRGFLKAHQKIHTESKMSFNCTKCDRKFPNRSSLKKHMNNHLTRLRYPCPLCKEDFELKGGLHAHMNTHQGERFSCTYCKRGFLRVEAYIRHVEAHSVVTDYYCERCDIYQMTERGFRMHQQKHEMVDQLQSESSANENGKDTKAIHGDPENTKVEEQLVVED